MDNLQQDLRSLACHLKRQQELKNPGLLQPRRNPATLLQAIRDELGACQRCPLHSSRTHLVFGDGNPDAELMFIGEAPGADEDRAGKPFVGKAGQLLTKIIAAIGSNRNEVYIANILKCRPPGNRNPRSEEIAACFPFLKKQIKVIQPAVICALGTFAAQTLLQTKTPIGRLRGRAHQFDQETLLIPTFHPAYLLRSPGKKKETWEDMQLIMRLLDKKLPD